MITLLRPLLFGDDVSSSGEDEDNDNKDTLPCTTSNIQQSIFSIISVNQSSRFFSQADATTPAQDNDVCTPDDKLCFLAALTRCSGDLIIYDCPEIFLDMLNIPGTDQLEAETLSLRHITPLTDLEYVRFGAIIENSVKLTGLGLTMYPADVPQAFCDSFAKYIHIQWLIVVFSRQMTNDRTDRNTFWSKMIANDGNGPLEWLLRNPQSQLKDLSLRSSNLQDHHSMAIAELLPFTHIKRIDVQENNIKAPGLLQFARQLPKMHSLAQIELEWNPWEESSPEVLEKCGAALLHGLIDNPCIQSLDCAYSLPQWLLLWHYLSLNRAGRKLLTSPSYGKQPSIPDGLWPRVLSRAGRPNTKGAKLKNFMMAWNTSIVVQPMQSIFSCETVPKYCPGRKSLSLLQRDLLASQVKPRLLGGIPVFSGPNVHVHRFTNGETRTAGSNYLHSPREYKGHVYNLSAY